jgi:tetratricopeptide (TPR) repeat protein
MSRSVILFLTLTLLLCSVLQAQSAEKPRLALPGQSWAIEFDGRGFEVMDQQYLPDLKGRMLMAENSNNGLVMTVFLDPALEKYTAAQFRDRAFKDLKSKPFELSDVKKYERDNMAFAECIVRDVGARKGVNQKNVYVYLIKGDTWIDFHLSKVEFKDIDTTIFNDFINSIAFIEPFEPISIENLVFGSVFYMQKDYVNAVIYYAKALEQEKTVPELGDDLWTVLVDNLGMAYAFTGDYDKAKATYVYGLAAKPEYPMFYYNLACVYAETKDLDSALQNLALAYKYKDNMLPSEKNKSIPDPTTDSSFKRYWKNEQFLNFLKTINQ